MTTVTTIQVTGRGHIIDATRNIISQSTTAQGAKTAKEKWVSVNDSFVKIAHANEWWTARVANDFSAAAGRSDDLAR